MVLMDDGTERELRYEAPRRFAELISPRADAAVVGLLPVATRRGENVHVDGAMSPELLRQIQTDYSVLLGSIMGSRPIDVTAGDVDQLCTGADLVATGFSAGVDSFFTLAQHFVDEPQSSMRITHLMFNDVGSHGRSPHSNTLFESRHARMRTIAARIGLPLIPTVSNLDDFYRDGNVKIGFQKTHTARNASVAPLLQTGIRCFYYSSAFRYGDASVDNPVDMAFADWFSLPLLSTSSLRMLSTGGAKSRVEKLVRVSENSEAHRSLDVCVATSTEANRINCSRCWKCLRTMLSLEVLGLLPLYEEVFDIAAFGQERESYVRSIRRSSDPLIREIRDLSPATGGWMGFARRLDTVRRHLKRIFPLERGTVSK
jgi:hypothetical protein